MADYTLTPANVLASTAAVTILGIAGATITAGQAVYQDTADLDSFGRGKFKLADANASGAQDLAGIALHGAASGQPLRIAQADPVFTHGLTTVAAGDIIILSATAGGLAPAADLASGWRANVAMVAISATTAVLGKLATTANKA